VYPSLAYYTLSSGVGGAPKTSPLLELQKVCSPLLPTIPRPGGHPNDIELRLQGRLTSAYTTATEPLLQLQRELGRAIKLQLNPLRQSQDARRAWTEHLRSERDWSDDVRQYRAQRDAQVERRQVEQLRAEHNAPRTLDIPAIQRSSQRDDELADNASRGGRDELERRALGR